jgi:hypothetical protein
LTSVPASNQWYTLTTSDGNGGAFVLWQDDRYTTAPDVFIQHLSSTGAMLIADAEAPRIASVRDVPNDQGGRVKVSWTASIQDLSPFYRVSEYRIWRSVPDHALLGLASAELRQTQVGAATYYWELIGTQSSGHFYNYSLVAPTTSDSVAGSNPRTAFMIEARTATGDAWWDSSPDSGYSVDNLAPGAPAGLVAVVEPSSGGTALHWLPSPESDVLQYRIYVGESSDFAPSVKSWIATVSDTGFVDMTRKYAYYRVTTTDIHGNEGASSLAQNAPVTDVGAGAAARMWLGAASPSPFFDRTSIRFGLASAGRVRLAVFDLGGREVASLVDREMGAGEHSVMWDGHGNGAKPALAGMYFYRLEVAGKVLTSRVVRMR